MSGLFAPGASKTVVRAKVLTPIESAALGNGLDADAGDLYYSAWVSFLDGLTGIEKGFYTWATVKLYYSVFYALRASLAFDGICAFHVDRSSFTVTAKSGSSPASCAERGTHKTVLKSFERLNPNHLLVSQQIDLQNAVDWLIERRETANYREVRFGEPDCESALIYVVENGVRNSINAYISETTALYVFDPDHALVAFPLRALLLIGSQLTGAPTLAWSGDEQAFLRSRARDKAGIFSSLVAEMKDLSLLA